MARRWPTESDEQSERWAWREAERAALRILEHKVPPAVHRYAEDIRLIASQMLDQLRRGVHVNPSRRPRRTRRRMGLIKDVRFFREQAGGVVGEAQRGALALTRAERYAADHGWTVVWEDDPDADWSWMSEREQQQPHEVYVAILYDRDPADRTSRLRPRVLASLGGIFDPSPEYRRVVEAELALEAMP